VIGTTTNQCKRAEIWESVEMWLQKSNYYCSIKVVAAEEV
jgi:hypothetical protein